MISLPSSFISVKALFDAKGLDTSFDEVFVMLLIKNVIKHYIIAIIVTIIMQQVPMESFLKLVRVRHFLSFSYFVVIIVALHLYILEHMFQAHDICLLIIV